jgi:general L-amino acid transport system substrate-binding protein
MVRQGDDPWFTMVRWALFAMLEAEEYGITSKNVDEMVKSPSPNIQRILGVNGEVGKGLGINNKWAYNIIKQVGNYGESFERNLGKNTAMKLDRGLNAQWRNGGVMYGWPVR